jgi:cytosine/adenosine deaminase-related metal-dependent hydrolase
LPCAGGDGDRPIKGGIVTVVDGMIVSVGDTSDLSNELIEDLGDQYGDVALLPGLVNAHTHLEFSELTQPLGHPGQPLPEWIGEVIAYRRANPRSDAACLKRGYEEALSTGTVAVGEISTSLNDVAFHPPGLVRFHEVICPTADRWSEICHALRERLAGVAANRRQGISPHAPYTLTWGAFEELTSLAQEKQLPVAMHLAESPEELELLATGGGAFRDRLETAEAWDRDARPLGLTPLDYLRRLAAAPQALVVHGNYLEAVAHQYLAQRADRMAVVYCPRTHAYFGHTDYPLAKMLAKGVRVCLGTDSRASNPDLNLFGELQFALRRHADVAPQKMLRMATTAPAGLFGNGDCFRGLTANARASIVAVQLPPETSTEPYMALADERSRVIGVWH